MLHNDVQYKVALTLYLSREKLPVALYKTNKALLVRTIYQHRYKGYKGSISKVEYNWIHKKLDVLKYDNAINVNVQLGTLTYLVYAPYVKQAKEVNI